MTRNFLKDLRRRVSAFINADFESAMFFLYMFFYIVCYSIATAIYAAFGLWSIAALPFAGVFISIFSTIIHVRGHKKPAALLRTISTTIIIFFSAYQSGGILGFPIMFLSGAALGAYLVVGKTAGKLVASLSIILGGVLYLIPCPPSALSPEQMRLAAIIVQCINIPFVVLVGAIYGARADVFRQRSEDEKNRAIESRMKTAAVMDAVRGAILSVNPLYQITEKNHITELILGKTQDFRAVLKQAEVEKPAEMREALDSILGEDLLNFEANELCLATTARINGRRYLISWKPLVDSKDTVKELVVAFIDNEEELRAKERAQQSDIINSYLGILSELDQEKSLTVISSISQGLAKARQHIPKGERQAAFRELHTIKGVARTLKFDTIAAHIHEAESHLGQADEALRCLDASEQEFEKVKSAAQRLKFDPRFIKLDRSILDQALNEHTERELLLSLKYKTLHTLCESFVPSLPAEAQKRGKPVPRLVVNVDKIFLTDRTLQALSAAFTHIISNALDHGIEDAETRLALGKPAQGSLFFNATVDDQVVIRLNDDGRGIALKRIMDKAKAMGMADPRRDYTPNEKAAFIFASELSTQDKVSETAGRGVGMNAVREMIQDIGGRVRAEVHTDSDLAPWELVIELPLDAIVQDDHIPDSPGLKVVHG